MQEEGLSQVWWTPTDCSGTPTWILLSNITYDITPPSLALLTTSGSTIKTVATSQSSSTPPSGAYSDSGLMHGLRRYTRKLHFFGHSSSSIQPAKALSHSGAMHGLQDVAVSASEARGGLQHHARSLHFFSISPSSSSSSKTYGANVVFSFSEPVTGFAQQYAFVKGGTVSGLNESVSGQNFSTAIVAESASTGSMLVLVTGSKSPPLHSIQLSPPCLHCLLHVTASRQHGVVAALQACRTFSMRAQSPWAAPSVLTSVSKHQRVLN